MTDEMKFPRTFYAFKHAYADNGVIDDYDAVEAGKTEALRIYDAVRLDLAGCSSLDQATALKDAVLAELDKGRNDHSASRPRGKETLDLRSEVLELFQKKEAEFARVEEDAARKAELQKHVEAAQKSLESTWPAAALRPPARK